MIPSDEAGQVPEPRRLSVVVIGLNEEAQLQACLDAVHREVPPDWSLQLIYVDSGSTDRSVDIAQAVSGLQVLHIVGPHRSAAIARNIGLRAATGELVQLVDGDSVMQPDWLRQGIKTLDERPDAACVFGHCIEMYPEQSIYMRVCSLDWNVRPGNHRLCGGNSLWRREVLVRHQFFDELLRVAEEPDLCWRVRQDGWHIVCVDHPMVHHDLGMVTFRQYWRRALGSGFAYASMALKYARTSDPLWLREALVNLMEPAFWLCLLTLVSMLFGITMGLMSLLGWWTLRVLQIAWSVSRRNMKARGWDAILYAVHCQVVRVPLVIGQGQALIKTWQQANRTSGTSRT